MTNIVKMNNYKDSPENFVGFILHRSLVFLYMIVILYYNVHFNKIKEYYIIIKFKNYFVFLKVYIS